MSNKEERKSLDQLSLDLTVALSHVQYGAVYRHAGSGDHYVPSLVFYNESDMEVHVAYHPLKATSVKFARPLTEWKEKFKKLADPMTDFR